MKCFNGLKRIANAVFLSTLGILFASQLAMAETGGLTAKAYQHSGKQYPPVFFVTNIEDKTFRQKLEQYQAFSEIDDESIGLPIGLRVLKGHRTKMDGAGLSTLFLSASTLGITPIVSNMEFKVIYNIFVQGDSIAEFEYKMTSTDVSSLWSNPNGNRETQPAEQVFLEHSLMQFLVDLREQAPVNAAFVEYFDYFEE